MKIFRISLIAVLIACLFIIVGSASGPVRTGILKLAEADEISFRETRSAELLTGKTESLPDETWPGKTWLVYATPEEAGWSSERLAGAKALWDSLQSDAFMVVYNGAMLVAWGDVSRRYMCHSVRKSFLSALYGIYVGDGVIDTSKTIGEVGIDDVPPLTAGEKRARIVDLLKARSGVYHAAAYETPGMKKRRPARGSKKPGEFWYYNNWDFNALGTIFKIETGTDLFSAFYERLAGPLGMEDFRLMDTYYHLEKQHSIHPAYPFRMSARDMARFGLLYLRDGRWRVRMQGNAWREGPRGSGKRRRGKRQSDSRGTGLGAGRPQYIQVIPEEWIRVSTRSYSKVPYWKGHGYGFLWWVNEDRADRKCGMYMALGYGGHMIAVLPGERLVVVNRPNTYIGDRTPMTDIYRLIDAVLEAKVSERKENPALVPLEAEEDRYSRMISRTVPLEKYTALFNLEREEMFRKTVPYVIGDIIGESVRFEVEGGNGRLLMRDSLGQRYYVISLSRERFLIEDMEIPVIFELDEEGRPEKITIDGSPGWKVYGKRVNGDGVNK